ncbi:uncharacterized protein LOC128957119, partial [Oppia nitens]|uniref:uncharacterized protein LOC128957119 n=1 Tax=Oppia nitens TaxID=1686743 RepID=UPI0023D9E698
MSRFVANGWRQLTASVNSVVDKYRTTVFGLRLISRRRYDQYFGYFSVTTCMLTTGLYVSYNTVLVDKYRSIFQSYRGQENTPLNESVAKLAETVWQEYNERLGGRRTSDSVRFFASVGSQPISIGTLTTGAWIGLPFTLSYATVDDVKTVDLRFFGQHDPYIKWRSPAGQAFIQSLVLSDRAKKYAVGHQILVANNANLALNALNVTTATAVAVGLPYMIITRTKLFTAVQHRFIVTAISLVIGYYLWSVVNQLVNYTASSRADKHIVSLGDDDYIDGAIEFLEKLMTRNAAFNVLTEDLPSWRMFTDDGEVKGLLTSKLLTIERRINYLKSFKQNNNNNNTN